jgi:hypothetical protein
MALMGFAFAFTVAFFTVPSTQPVKAEAADNVMGWAWADPIGWISLNDLNPGSGGGSYGVNLDFSTGLLSGFGWSENAGWICFGSSCSHPDCSGTVPASIPAYNSMIAKVDPPPYASGGTIRNVHGWAKVCNEGDRGWISFHCNDLVPSACGSYAYRVPFDMSTHAFEDTTAGGSPTNGTPFAWNANDDRSGFGYISFRAARVNVPEEAADPVCSDGIDNDLDGASDCTDSSCVPLPICTPPPDLTEDQCPLGTADLCCSDSTDNEGDGVQDCEDPDCQGMASMCTVEWLETKFGSVYAQKGIAAIAAPASQYNASYCLSASDGMIEGFASQIGCITSSTSLTLPSAGTGYRGSLGVIDVVGIENGRYGPVQVIADGSALPEDLGGRIYLYTGAGALTLPAKTFQNGTGPTGRGNGLLFVKGSNLRIVGDLVYSSPEVQGYLRNLASFGVIVTADAGGTGGNIVIDPSVRTLSGAFFAERSIRTGASTLPLTVFGLMASRELVFDRTGGTAAIASETVIFDGRAVANPPPGMQDIGKSLPTVKDAF